MVEERAAHFHHAVCNAIHWHPVEGTYLDLSGLSGGQIFKFGWYLPFFINPIGLQQLTSDSIRDHRVGTSQTLSKKGAVDGLVPRFKLDTPRVNF